MERTNQRDSDAVARVMYLLGAAMAAGTLIDLGVLWIGQYQDSTQWEFVAVMNTLEGMSGFILAFGLVFTGLWIEGNKRTIGRRILGGLMILMGVVALGLGGLLALDYAALRTTTEGTGGSALFSTSVKGVLLSLVYVVAMGAVAMLMLRGNKRN